MPLPLILHVLCFLPVALRLYSLLLASTLAYA